LVFRLSPQNLLTGARLNRPLVALLLAEAR